MSYRYIKYNIKLFRSHLNHRFSLLTFIDKFPYSGQNLAMGMTTVEPDTSPATFANMVKNQWFKEYENGGPFGWMKNMNKFTQMGGDG